MLRKEPGQTGVSDSEDRLHRTLALLLGAVAGVAVWLRDAPPAAFHEGEARSGASLQPPRRATIEAAIAELERWFESTGGGEPRTPLDANRRLLALGRAALEPRSASAPLIWKNLDALARPSTPEARPASLPLAGSDPVESDASPTATLATLLETGVPLDDELPLPSGAVSVRRLLELALPEPGARRDSADPWTLDLLSFAVLAGMAQRHGELERQTVASLTRLEREQRRVTQTRRDRAAAAQALGTAPPSGSDDHGWSRELQLASAVFRAVAVLGEPELEQRALRYLNALLLRHELESDLRDVALQQAETASGRVALQVEAMEALGRLEQALYGAHVTFRRGDRPGPPPRAASSMRRAAAELLIQLEALKSSGAFEPDGARAPVRPDALARAAAQALRGLRTARIAS
ncbi:MAG TPA: hypothetical protein VMG12_13255 [Polyangiaceae bacterium]|nr:hypothetical protein [Polyangiaceae bacterium]